MPRVKVNQGDDLSKIACDSGLSSWRPVYDEGANAPLWDEMPNPDVLKPGVHVQVPEVEPRTESGQSNSVHRYKLKRPKTRLRLRLEDEFGEPRAGCSYRLEIPGRPALEGRTKQDGVVDHLVLATDVEGTLTVFLPATSAEDEEEEYQFSLSLGALDPVDMVTGQQARLNNLGYESGPVDGIRGPLTRAATREFQQAAGLVVDGIVGPKTAPALETAHGC